MSKIRKALSFLVFLPNITPFAAIFKSEIFPWAFLYSLRKGFYLSNRYWLFLIYMGLSAVFVLLTGRAEFMGIMRSSFALLNASIPLFVILIITELDFEQLKKGYYWVFGTHIVLCFLQITGLVPDFIGSIMNLFIIRFNTESWGLGRGVTGLFAEPSYLAVSMSYYFVFGIYLMRRSGNKMAEWLLIGLLLIYQVAVIRSGTGMVYLLLVFLTLPKPKFIIPIVLVMIVGMVVAASFAKDYENSPRSLHLLYNLIYEQRYKDFYQFALSESGFRMVSVLGAFNYGVTHPFGSGIGAWGPASIESLESVGLPATDFGYFVTYYGGMFEGLRPASFFADVLLELGWVGAILFIRFLWPLVCHLRFYIDNASRPLIILFLFNILFLGTIGDPVPYIFLGIFCRMELGESRWQLMDVNHEKHEDIRK